MGHPLQYSPFIRSRIPVSLDTLLFLAISTLPIASTASLETRYIDDEYGDSVTGIPPIYNGSEWAQGATCSTCGFRPDPSQTFNGTWHDNTHYDTQPPSTIEFHFMGITLDVYCLVPSNLDPFTFGISAYNLSFVLDGQPLDQTFTYNSIDVQYNVSVLSLTNLAQVPHIFTMIAAAPGMTTTIQFDYAIYTVDTSLLTSISSSSSTSGSSMVSSTPATASLSFTSSPSTTISSSSDLSTAKKHSNLAAIVGSTIGGILFLVLSLALIFYYRRYKHRIRQRFFTSLHNDEMRVDPFHFPSVGLLVSYNRPFINPPAKNALWNPSNVMQEVEDPRAAKRAVAEEVRRRRREELPLPQEVATRVCAQSYIPFQQAH